MKKSVEQYYKKIDEFILNNADAKKIENIKIYLKNQAQTIYGIPMKRLKSLFLKHLSEFDKLESEYTYSLINQLFMSKAFEKQIIACMLLKRYYYKFEEKNIVYIIKDYILNNIIINWAVADQIATNTFSKFNDKSFLHEFSTSFHYLLRRCSVAVFAEMHLTDKDMDMLIINIKELLQEKDEYVMRAAGWACRNIFNYNESKYFEFINENCHLMPRIMLRNAIEFLDEDIRVNILVSSKEKRHRMILSLKGEVS
ncbi:DNA alkylation repair protein [Mucispirillum schaedleri]|jgi:3-methyladenine DNA glycosylase AlkD|uniref:Uncharacterized protein n=1 Tax=Mucispirillum schaedleri ASF457 TaxID=1379858 RepID=V2QDD5_9BACT|nr:DNA alkylation repair protein [Mucispirillum schaedleri]MCX4360402.1 DNA alkylation repair protein [Mucispirillum schaedleri]USF24187.1 hypothetical protein N508_001269 [Mucispirillum schaedleri ASF457]